MPNRRFRRLVMDDVFWRAVDLGGRALPPGTVGQLLGRGVLSLRLARANLAAPLLSLPETGFVFDGSRKKPKVTFSPLQTHEDPSRIFPVINSWCVLSHPQITTLDLSMASVPTAELEELITHAAPTIKRLSLEQGRSSLF